MADGPPRPGWHSGSPGRGRTSRQGQEVIYLHMVGGPPQMDLYDYKPKMKDWYDKDLPDPCAWASDSPR